MVEMTPLQAKLAEKMKADNLAPALIQKAGKAMDDAAFNEEEKFLAFLQGAIAIARHSKARENYARLLDDAAVLTRQIPRKDPPDGD